MRKYKSSLVILIFLLVGCNSQNAEYIDTGKQIGQFDIFLVSSQAVLCDGWFSMPILETDEYSYEYVNQCPYIYMVQINEDYVNLIEYIAEENISSELIIESGIGYIKSNEPISSNLEIDISKLRLVEVIVREFNGDIQGFELAPDAVEVLVEIDFSDIDLEIFAVLSQYLESDDMICRSSSCLPYGIHPEITLKLTDGDTIFTFRLEEYTTAIYIQKESSTSDIAFFYFMTAQGFDSEFRVIYDTIYQAYQEQKDSQ